MKFMILFLGILLSSLSFAITPHQYCQSISSCEMLDLKIETITGSGNSGCLVKYCKGGKFKVNVLNCFGFVFSGAPNIAVGSMGADVICTNNWF